MDDNFLAERGRDDVVSSAKRLEDVLVGEATDGIEPEFVPDQRDTATDDNAMGCEQRDGLRQSERHGGSGSIEDRQRVGVSPKCGFGDQGRGDGIGVALRSGQEGPVTLSVLDLVAAESLRGRRDRPAGSHLLQFDNPGCRGRAVGYAEVSDLDRPLTKPAIDLSVDDQGPTDSAADIHVKQR